MFAPVQTLADKVLEAALPKMTVEAAGCYRCQPYCVWFCCTMGARVVWRRCCGTRNCGDCVTLSEC